MVPAATLAPDTASHLSDGVVVQTRLVARLLGLKVLRVDGVVHLAPARLESIGTTDQVTPRQTRRLRPARLAPDSLGVDLVRASQLLDDGDRRLGSGGRHHTGLPLAPRRGAR